MSRTIWKFIVDLDQPVVEMPRNAEIIHIGVEDFGICIWAVVNPHNLYEERHFAVYGEGHMLPDDPGQHLGTVQVSSNTFHLFEEEEFDG